MPIIAELMRITAFTASPLDYRRVPIADWWTQVAAVEPEQVTTNTSKSQAVAEGPFANGRLALAVGPLRVDLQNAARPPTEDDGVWPAVGDWPACAGAFADQATSLLSSIGPTKRLAFGAILSTPTSDKPGGYRILEEGLNDLSLKLPDDASDFMLQVNRPISARSGPEGLKINRLAKWSVSIAQPIWFTLTVAQSSKDAKASAIGGEPRFALRLELDFNTPADWSGEFVPNDAPAIMHELVDVAIQYVGERIKP